MDETFLLVECQNRTFPMDPVHGSRWDTPTGVPWPAAELPWIVLCQCALRCFMQCSLDEGQHGGRIMFDHVSSCRANWGLR